MTQNKLIAFIAAIALIVGIAVNIYIDESKKNTPNNALYIQKYPTPRALTDFSLVNHHGETFTDENLKGRWTLAFLGYTYCPDICPVTLSALAKVYPSLSAIASEFPIQVLFISVDPKRDSVERLNEYIGFFNEDFIGVTADHTQLFPLVRSMGMMYAMSGSTDEPNYLVDHSASVVLIDPKGHVVGRFKPILEPGQLAISDVEQILSDMPVIMNGKG